MITAGELSDESERILAEVVGRVRGEQWEIELPPLLDRPGYDRPMTIRAATDRLAADDRVGSDEVWAPTIVRALLANEIAMHLGSRAVPLTEKLARGLCEQTEPEAEQWRAAGFFRDPIPLPEHVHTSWRDRFLMLAGRDPHPLEDRAR